MSREMWQPTRPMNIRGWVSSSALGETRAQSTVNTIPAANGTRCESATVTSRGGGAPTSPRQRATRVNATTRHQTMAILAMTCWVRSTAPPRASSGGLSGCSQNAVPVKPVAKNSSDDRKRPSVEFTWPKRWRPVFLSSHSVEKNEKKIEQHTL
eukprot:Amastigsp_a512737_14.p3 type:complete len:154 gc:universal Amastigsp_a512737_14:932-471(-)